MKSAQVGLYYAEVMASSWMTFPPHKAGNGINASKLLGFKSEAMGVRVLCIDTLKTYGSLLLNPQHFLYAGVNPTASYVSFLLTIALQGRDDEGNLLPGRT